MLDKLSTTIVKSHDIIGIEGFSVKNMLKNKQLAKSISEVAWSAFRTMLEYEANWYGIQVVGVGENFPQISFDQLVVIKTKTLKMLLFSVWVCPRCKTHHQRDSNASINLRNESLRLTAGTAGIA